MSLAIFTAYVGMILAPGTLHPFLKVVAILAISLGAGGAGCLNMAFEAHIDATMHRTKNRPIPQSYINANDAITLGMILSGLGIILLSLTTNPWAATLLGFTIFFYAVVYTLWLKPRTDQNIVIGGLSGALPPLIGWTSISPDFSFFPWIMVAIIFFWTPAHFWVVSILAAEDYKLAKLPMLPNTKGIKTTKEQILYYTLLTLLLSYLPYAMNFKGLAYLGFVNVIGSFYLAINIYVLYSDEKKYLFYSFFASLIYLFFLFLSFVIF